MGSKSELLHPDTEWIQVRIRVGGHKGLPEGQGCHMADVRLTLLKTTGRIHQCLHFDPAVQVSQKGQRYGGGEDKRMGELRGRSFLWSRRM